jgi:hypothetical protein
VIEFIFLLPIAGISSDPLACENDTYRLFPSADIIVGLDVALKGPFPLVGESEVSRTDRKNFQFVWNTHSKNQLIWSPLAQISLKISQIQ